MTENISTKLKTIAENMPKVYEAGRQEGYTEGAKSERDSFWDAFQENGNRTNYYNAFNSAYWNHITFKPTHDLKPVGDARNMFATFGNMSTYPKMTKILEDAGVILDTSLVTNARQMFYACRVSDLPPLDFSSATDLYSLFYDSWRIETIEITLAPNKVTTALGMFDSCSSLTNLTIHGVIDVTDIDLHWSTKLSKDSIESVINALSTTTTGLTITLSKAAVNKAFETSTGAEDGVDTLEWIDFASTKSNWTISLI